MFHDDIPCYDIKKSFAILRWLQDEQKKKGTNHYIFVHSGGVRVPEELMTQELADAVKEKFDIDIRVHN